jgi:hypothetical protein
MNWLARHRYFILLVALLLLLVIYPLLHDVFHAAVLYEILLAGVTFTAVMTVIVHRRVRLVVLLLVIPLFAVSWTGRILPGVSDPVGVMAFHGTAALLLAVGVVEILISIYRGESVTADSVFGAFCGYLLLGVAFAHLFCILEVLRPGSFRGDLESMRQLQDFHLRHFNLMYFSLVTLTTVGYGDIVATTGAARGLASVEAVAGQFYLAVLIAELIGRRVSSATQRPANRSEAP